MNWFWIIIAITTGPSAPLLIKQYFKDTNTIPKWLLIIMIIIMYSIFILSYVKLLDKEKVGTTYTLIKGLSIIITLLYGIIIFEETINKYELIGILFIIIGAIFLAIKIYFI